MIENKRIPTAAYCRVSTKRDTQDGSYEVQRDYYEKLIIRWRCGFEMTACIELKSEEQKPKIMAEKWDAYLLRSPDLYPDLTEKARKARGENIGWQ